MKINASLVSSPSRLAGLLACVLAASAVASWVLAIMSLADAVEKRAELPLLRTRLATMTEEARVATSRDPLPSLSALSEIRRRVSELNAMSSARGWPAPALLAWLEERMPESVYLRSLQHQLKEGEVALVVESSSAETLTNFLLRLEGEPHFKEVLLAKQSPRSEVRRSVQFEIRLKERP